MTTHTVIPNSQIAVGAPVTNALMTALRDNLYAIQEGDASASSYRIQNAALAGYPWQSSAYTAGSVDQTAIGGEAVGQSEVKKAYQTASLTSATSVSQVHTGGAYALGILLFATDAGNYGYVDFSTSSDEFQLSAIGRKWRLTCSTYNTGTVYAYAYYFTASPPYDLGDGEVAGFVWALIENGTGRIVAINSADDPPWAYNGPTIITPTRYERDGRVYIKNPQIIQAQRQYALERKSGTATPDRLNELLAAVTVREVLLTQQIKNADMNLIPHPFLNVPPGHTVVMLDPMSDVLRELWEMRGPGQSFHELIHDDYIRIGNTDLPRAKPAGMMCVAPRWR